MKKSKTTKYKKRHKKEVANRKAKQEKLLDRIAEHPLVTEIHLPEPNAKPVSPARRAFQDA